MANLEVLVFDILVICNSDLRIYCVVLMKLNHNTYLEEERSGGGEGKRGGN